MGEYCNGVVLKTNTQPDSDAVTKSAIILTRRSTVIRAEANYDECLEQLYHSSEATIALSIRKDVLLGFGLPFLDWLEKTPSKKFHELMAAFLAVHAVVFVVDDSFDYGAFAFWESKTLKRQYASDEFSSNNVGEPFEWEVEGTHPGDLALMATEMLCGMDVISFSLQQDDFTLFK